MDEKERKELIEKIKTRVEVWDNKTYEFIDAGVHVELTNGNKFPSSGLYIKKFGVYDVVKVSLVDAYIGKAECNLHDLTDDSLERLSDELPLTFTIYISYHNDDAGFSAPILTEPVRTNFDNDDVERWLEKNFPLFDWESCDEKFIYYTEFTDSTGPYLCAVLLKGEC